MSTQPRVTEVGQSGGKPRVPRLLDPPPGRATAPAADPTPSWSAEPPCPKDCPMGRCCGRTASLPWKAWDQGAGQVGHQVDELEQHQMPHAGRSEFPDERTRSGTGQTHSDTAAAPLRSARGVTTALQMSAGNQAVTQLMRSSS